MTTRALAAAGSIFLLLVGCATESKSPGLVAGGPGTELLDEDGDGDGVLASEDCDDQNASVYPGAEEICDGLDNDCDGSVDPETASGVREWSVDGDGDGFGDPDTSVRACEPPSGAVANALDCDDEDPSVHPDAIEVCDGLDNDCDTRIDDDDDDIDASTGSVFFADVDADGFGDPDFPVSACVLPSGFVEDDTDCDDSTDAVNPEAPEICDDLDNDCDGLTDDEDDSVDLATLRTFYIDEDGDGYGVFDQVIEGCSLPSGYSTEASDCDDTDSAINPAAAEICDPADVDEDCDGDADDADSSVDLSTGTTYYADTDTDGYGDSSDAGAAYCDDPSDGTRMYVTDATDCDDGDGAINPAATEVCDPADVDEDCDGVADDADSSVDGSTQTAWYVDGDEDGYGDGTATAACDDPGDATTTYASDDGDCADSDAAINPAASEVCDEQDNDCDGDIDDADADLDTSTATEWFADGDGDGYGETGSAPTVACEAPSSTSDNDGDCDDANGDVNPAATEVCDDSDVDEDCNGTADDADSGVDSSTFTDWYTDGDSDGYGDLGSTASSLCDAPSGTVDDNTDCDDSEASVYPGATEVCDLLDNDCDGDIDDADSSLDTSTTTTWAPDTDVDGYGDDSVTVDACVAPSGYISTLGDCDDGDADINPDATEVCDEVDNDCDTYVDDEDDSLDVSVGGSTYYADADGDGYGDETDAGQGFCDDPGSGYAEDDTDCDDGDDEVNPGATEVCNLVDDDCDTSTSSDGMAWWEPSSGSASDLTSTLAAGTSSAPVAFSSTGDGTAYVCAGTWYANIEIDGDTVELVGVDGSGSVIIDGAGDDSVVDIKNGAVVSATGFTLQNGDGSKGGAVSVDESTLSGSDLAFLDSVADEGGGMYVDDSTVDLSDCEFDGNSADDYGGGLFVEDSGLVTLTACDITDNEASDGGGAYVTSSSTLTIDLADVSSNDASNGLGGGIFCYDGDEVGITDSDFTNNSAYYYGGGVSLDGCELTMDGGSFTSNSAYYSGAIDSYDDISITDVSFTSNTASVDGGAIWIELGRNGTCDIINSTFTSNTAGRYGGGVYVEHDRSSAVTTFTGTTFTGSSPSDIRYYYSVSGLWQTYTTSASSTLTCQGSSGCS